MRKATRWEEQMKQVTKWSDLFVYNNELGWIERIEYIKRMDVRMDGWMDGWMDGRTDGR